MTRGRNSIRALTASQNPACHQQRLPPPAKTTLSNMALATLRNIGRQWTRFEPVEIGPGCWIGTGAVILPGARIGRNVVVAAGAVVRGTVPDHAVVAGAPARVVRRWTPAEGWQPPLRTPPPVPIPDGVTSDQLVALSELDEETVERLARLDEDGAAEPARLEREG